MAKEPDEKFSPAEAQRRFDAALRGARIAGHKPKNSMTPKRQKAQRKAKQKKPSK